jgi:hypothetical protein
MAYRTFKATGEEPETLAKLLGPVPESSNIR